MVKRSIATIICLTALAVVSGNVSLASDQPRKLMEFGNVRWEDEMARLDYLESKLREEPDSIAYVIVYGASSGAGRGDTEARVACIKDYMRKRRAVQANRIVIMKGGYRQDSTVEFWLARRGESGPTATPTVSPKDARFIKGRIKNWRGRCNL